MVYDEMATLTPRRSALRADGTIKVYPDDQIVHLYHSERQGILSWCDEQGIEADLLWAGVGGDGVRSIYGIENEMHRSMFTLRWA